MSVTFTPAFDRTDIAGYRVACADGAFRDTRRWTATQYGDAADAALIHDAVCTEDDCRTYSGTLHTDMREPWMAIEVNMANKNAAHILDVLGIQVGDTWADRCYGTITPDDLLGRILLALALNPADAGTPARRLTEAEVTAAGGLRGGQQYDCGRHPGYTDERLTQLRDLAEACRAAGRDITWS